MKSVKRLLVLACSVLLFITLITGCTSNNKSIEDSGSEAETEKIEVETHYTENQTEMANYMTERYALVSDGWVYTIGWGKDTYRPLFLKMRTDGSDDTVLKYFESPKYINIKGEYIYVLLWNDESNSYIIYRYRLGGEEETKLVEGAWYFSIVGDRMYYCKTEDGTKMTTFNSCNLDGSDEVVVMDKEIYYPYITDDGMLFYQDDNDNETIHKYDLSTKEDIQITKEKTYAYVLNDDYMYCILNDNSPSDGDTTGYLAKVNLDTLEYETLYDGVFTWSFGIKDDRLYFINTNDEYRIYSIDKNLEYIPYYYL